MTPRLRTSLRMLSACALFLGAGASVYGQSLAGPPEDVRLRLGPLFLNPTLSLMNAGVDDNVLNEPTSASPKSDVTVTATPKTDFWVRFGPTWLSGSVREDLVYYKENVDQRSANITYELGWLIPFNRITFRPSVIYLDTHDRPGFEIDARVPRTDLTYAGEVDVKWLSKSAVVLKASRFQEQFEQGAMFDDINLHDALNRVSTQETVSLEYHLTPLTTASVDYSLGQDRFTYDTARDSDSRTVGGSIRFDPAALIKGTATMGYEDYRPHDPGTPGYKGLTATAALSYVLLGSTRLSVNGSREVRYSYDISQPYYVQTGGSFVLSQRIFGPVDVQVLGGLYELAYQDRVGALVAEPDRIDHMKSIGGGVGYHFGRDARLGFTVQQDRRDSILESHRYTGLRYGFSLTYGATDPSKH